MRDQVTSQKLGSTPLSWMMIPTSFKWLFSMASSFLEMTYSTYNRMFPIVFSDVSFLASKKNPTKSHSLSQRSWDSCDIFGEFHIGCSKDTSIEGSGGEGPSGRLRARFAAWRWLWEAGGREGGGHLQQMYHDIPWRGKKTCFGDIPIFPLPQKKTLELKKWSFLTKWSFLMSGILKIGMLKCLKDWSITYSPATRLERVLPWTGCGFLDLFCGLRQGIKKTQDWDLFGVLPFWSSIGSLLFDLYVRHVQMVEILGVTY